MKVSQFTHVSELMRTKGRIERDLALLEEADEQSLRMTGIELYWSGFPEKQIDFLFHADGGARLWADDDLHEAFSAELRKLIRGFLMKDLDCCQQELTRLGVEIDGTERALPPRPDARDKT